MFINITHHTGGQLDVNAVLSIAAMLVRIRIRRTFIPSYCRLQEHKQNDQAWFNSSHIATIHETVNKDKIYKNKHQHRSQ